MKQRFGEGEVLFGTFYKFNCEPIVEMLGMAGMDFIIIDAEHAAYSYWDMENMCRAANGVGMNAVIRVPNSSAEYILHAGDMGAQGIQVPNSKTLEEARAAAESMRYAPFGTRGLGLTTRGSGYCLGGSYTDSDSYSELLRGGLPDRGRRQNAGGRKQQLGRRRDRRPGGNLLHGYGEVRRGDHHRLSRKHQKCGQYPDS